jgi:cytochrome c oxidase cbb3-type subunit 2
MIRSLRDETERYGHYSASPARACTTVRSSGDPSGTGPDLARVGGKYSDDWHRVHLNNPRDVVPESNMPAFAWLERPVDASTIEQRMRALTVVGTPYTEEQIKSAPEALKGKTEMDALIAYLQGLGTAIKRVN